MEAAAGKGEASAASQSAECLLCHMTLKVNPVTLASYGQTPVGLEGSGACGAIEIEIGIGESRRPLSS